MNRRNFLGTLLGSFFVPKVVPELAIDWGSDPDFTAIFYGGARGGGKTNRMMYGIPYHYTNASTGTWLGFERKIK